MTAIHPTSQLRQTHHSQQLTSDKNTSVANKPADSDKIASRLGGDLDRLERQLLNAYGKPEPSDKEIKKLEMQYKRASLVLEGFLQLMRNKHELLMRGIQGLAVR